MRVVMFYHSLVSDWNHGNAHFLRGVVAELQSRGHDVRVLEPEDGWSRFYRRWIRLEAILGVGSMLFVAGLAIDLALFAVWAGGGRIDAGLQLAALAQSMLIGGAELGFGAFLVVAVTTSKTPAADDTAEQGEG